MEHLKDVINNLGVKYGLEFDEDEENGILEMFTNDGNYVGILSPYVTDNDGYDIEADLSDVLNADLDDVVINLFDGADFGLIYPTASELLSAIVSTYELQND